MTDIISASLVLTWEYILEIGVKATKFLVVLERTFDSGEKKLKEGASFLEFAKFDSAYDIIKYTKTFLSLMYFLLLEQDFFLSFLFLVVT